MDERARELWYVFTGSDESDESDDGTYGDSPPGGGSHGYEKDAEQRGEDCERVRALLEEDGLSPNIRCRHGASLLYHALQYDHRHPPQMLKVVIKVKGDAEG